MSELERIILADEPPLRDRSLDSVCGQLPVEALLAECEALERLRHASGNLYQRVRALFFLYAIHRFHLPSRPDVRREGKIPYRGYESLLDRRYEEAIREFRRAQAAAGPNEPVSSALAAAYRALGFQTLAGQVRRSVRSVRGNQWMFRTGHPADYPLRIRPELCARPASGLFPILREATPVRMDFSHSGWSDIFFLGMDFPEGARVLNVSIDLKVRGAGGAADPAPPVEAYFRVIDEPLLRLVSVDLGAVAEITALAEVFDFARDYLGLLKAAVIAAGIVPPGMEGASQPFSQLLAELTGKPGYGIEIVSKVNGIPKGSRLAVSTSLLACLIAVCMRATGQARNLTGQLCEEDRRLAAARAILGEWLGGSGGGWQDSGGVWPGVKLIQGTAAAPGDPEFGVSRGCLLPRHTILSNQQVTPETRRRLQESLVLVHGGMAQDVGPILEMVTERYLLRSEAEWEARREAIAILDEILGLLERGDIAGIGEATERNFQRPIHTIIPWAGNAYTDALISRVRAEMGRAFWGFWMLGGMAGGGMGFLFDPAVKRAAEERLAAVMGETKRRFEQAVPFAIDPVVYEFRINERGTEASLLNGDAAFMPGGYYALVLPPLLRRELRTLSEARRAEVVRFGSACRTEPALAGTMQTLLDRLLPHASAAENSGRGQLAALLDRLGFDRDEHERIRAGLRSGRIGLAQNRLPPTASIEDAGEGDVIDAAREASGRHWRTGMEALREGRVAVVTLAGGIGSRWTGGAGVVKAIHPFCRLGGRYRTFLEVHLAKSRRAAKLAGTALPHVVTTSYLTGDAIVRYLEEEKRCGYEGPLFVSPGRAVGLRLVPMTRDLRFAWEEMPQQTLDVQQQKVQDSLRAALIQWAAAAGEGSDYTDNVPAQCLHPVGHWYEAPNMLRNGVLAQLLEQRPQLQHLMVHNIDTLGASVDPAILGLHIEHGAALTTEVVSRLVGDRGGGLARVDGRLRLVEGLAMPDEETEFRLSYYNSATSWIDLDKLLAVFRLSRGDLADAGKVAAAVRSVAARMPAYVTLKEVKKRWGKGQEDIFPVAQYEKLWGDMTALPELACRFVAVPRLRGQQLKEAAELDGWLRDGSAAHVASLCEWD